MYQNLQQLKSHSLEEIMAYKEDAIKTKAKLEALKAEGGKAWTEKLQEELNEVVLFLVDVDDVIEEKKAKVEPSSAEYKVKLGTEKMVHLQLVSGRRYNPNTGVEESRPFTQMFTFAEWQLFKNNFSRLGYTVLKVLHNPYDQEKK